MNTRLVIVTPPDRYGIVLDPNGSTNSGVVVDKFNTPYYVKQAYIYSTGQIVNICAQNSEVISTGSLVLISESQKITVSNPSSTYYVVTQVDTTLSHTGYSDYNPGNANPWPPLANDAFTAENNAAIKNAAAASNAGIKLIGTAENGVTMIAGKVTSYVAGASATIALNDPFNGVLVTIILPSNKYNLIAGADLRKEGQGSWNDGWPYAAFTPIPDMSTVKGLGSMSNDVFAQNNVYAVAYVDNATGVTVSVTFIFYTFNQAHSGALEWPWSGSASVPVILYGDVNGDGTVTRADLIRFGQYISGIDRSSYFNTPAADVNGDGVVTRADLMRFGQYISGIDRSPLGP